MATGKTFGRRGFLRGAASAAAVAGFPAVVPARVFGADAPSNRLNLGAIGVGGMGTGDLNGFLGDRRVRVVGVCDVDRRHRERARQLTNRRYGNDDCTAYADFRELIGRGDLDVVMTALPDHWHAVPAIAAARAGCDIHGQKPFARSIREGRAMVDACERHGRIWQTGSQQRSDGRFRFAAELAINGRCGTIRRVEVGLPTGGPGGDPEPKDPPAELDWEFWLGPAPERPYQGFGPHWNWRWIMDYSGGQLTDWCGHHVDIAHWGLGYDRTGPVKVTPIRAEYPDRGLYDVPTSYHFICTYADGVEVSVANNRIHAQGCKWIGDDGWVYVRRGQIDAEPKSLLREKIGTGEIQLYRSGGHKRNFIDCCISRHEPICPAEVGHRSISVGLLGEIAMLTGRTIRWDPDKEEILDDPGAAALLGRSYREPWQL